MKCVIQYLKLIHQCMVDIKELLTEIRDLKRPPTVGCGDNLFVDCNGEEYTMCCDNAKAKLC